MKKETIEHRINVRVDAEIKEAFLRKAESEGKTVTNVILELVNQYLGRDAQTNELADIKQRLEAVERSLMGELLA
ncbi:ribbon-helix-helix protein, CopG family [Nostoc sp. PA-18-2419]|uniref:ribbon-helix-helix protein, CopG family n=1 Tax=Nostoc sp. PA-18-2419 TaxID=2575443 RepID=UPI001108E20B|nr:ribbon-helix-helix protein, CopG family [Nostoc sp. PA-18-2419]